MNRPAMEVHLVLLGYTPVFSGTLKLLHSDGERFYATTAGGTGCSSRFAYRGSVGPLHGRHMLDHCRCRWQRFTTADLIAILRKIDYDS